METGRQWEFIKSEKFRKRTDKARRTSRPRTDLLNFIKHNMDWKARQEETLLWIFGYTRELLGEEMTVALWKAIDRMYDDWFCDWADQWHNEKKKWWYIITYKKNGNTTHKLIAYTDSTDKALQLAMCEWDIYWEDMHIVECSYYNQEAINKEIQNWARVLRRSLED